jgi:hypothetical protein
MAQLVVRNIEDHVKEGLRARAVTHGRSLEEEVRVILRSAVGRTDELEEQPIDKSEFSWVDNPEEGLGTRIAKLFEGNGIDFEIPRMEDWPNRVTFDE